MLVGLFSLVLTGIAKAETPPTTEGTLHWENFIYWAKVDTAAKYVFAVQMDEVATYVQAVRQEEETRAMQAVAAYVSSVRQQQSQARVVAPQQVTRSSGATGSCGGATNGADRYIQRESGGNPGIYNTGGSGAWGCYQIMPGTWSSSCRDLGVYGQADAATQAACASRLPLSAWGG